FGGERRLHTLCACCARFNPPNGGFFFGFCAVLCLQQLFAAQVLWMILGYVVASPRVRVKK
ncbi:MAG: hypothetical protein ACRC8I_00315, partial [Plesiomonas shigelloides]